MATAIARKVDRLREALGEGDLLHQAQVEEPPVSISFREFIRDRFIPAVAEVEGEAHPALHLEGWADRLESNRHTLTEAARGHLKSTLFYALLAWRLEQMRDRSIRGLYFSAKRELAQMHLALCKEYIAACGIPAEDLTTAESYLRYKRGRYVFEVRPEGILAAARGRHIDIILLDDVIKDPDRPLELRQVEKATRVFKRKIYPMLRDEATEVHVAGTPVTENDLLAYLKGLSEFDCRSYPAIDEDGRPLWPEGYPLELLDKIRSTIGEKEFGIEYLLRVARLEDSYLDPGLIARAIGEIREEGAICLN